MNAVRLGVALEPGAAPAEATAGLALEHVSHAYGAVPVLEDISLTVAPGELVCLLGPSGCGKTTTLRLAAGLEELQQGSIAVAGAVRSLPGRTEPPERRRVGLMFQDFALFPHLCVLDNVAFGLRALPVAERRARAQALLERVGLGGLAQAFPHALSGGEQQRVALARALAPRPGVMLLDEPFSGLDARLRDQVRDDTLALLKEQGVATLLVTHDAEEALMMADRVALLSAGRLVQVGPPEALYFRPASRFAAEFFGDLNRYQGVVRGGAAEFPLGRVPCPGLAEGSAVEVLARPEAFQLREGEGELTGEVEAARFLGATTVLALRAAGGCRFRARCRTERGFAAGQRLRFSLDLRYAFVFPSG
jgi:iron(III) transport system ATP-binding protein